jgi:hypothetical protein
MTKTDTSANAVERLAYAMEARIIETYGGHGTVLERPDDDCNAAAATLRALLAERDEARADAREAAARREGIEAAANEIDCGCDIRDAVLERLEERGLRSAPWLCRHGNLCCALQAAEIRTLKLEGGR